MAKGCIEEFNPWPPFVDIFASVILVLMLFLLITVVNIGYYAQFKSKKSYTAESNIKAPDDTADIVQSLSPERCVPVANVNTSYDKTKQEKDLVSFRKIEKPKTESEGIGSLFSGGKGEGNSVSYRDSTKDKLYDTQNLVLKKRSVELFFRDKEIFISTPVKHKIRNFINSVNRQSKNAKFTIYVSDPSNIISSTISKQISLGRILNIKNIIKKTNVNPRRIILNLQEQVAEPSKYGSLYIKAEMP